jgi:hypothetical protein
MKKLIAVMLFLPLFSFAQQYSAVVDIPNKTAVQSYRTAKDWFAIVFNSANDVIQLDDPAEMKIIGKGVKQIVYPVKNVPAPLDVHFILIVQFKDGRYKYDLESSKIVTLAGESLTYDSLKELTTDAGLTAYYKKKGVKSWMIGKNGFQENIESNKLAVAEVENQLHRIVDDLTLALKKETGTNNNW